MYPPFVACFDEKLDVSIHERDSHCDCGAVRQDKIWVLTEFFDHAEDVVPSTAIQARTMVTELIDDLKASASHRRLTDKQIYLLHFKGCYNGLDKNCSTDGSARHANVVLGQVEDIVPQTRLEM